MGRVQSVQILRFVAALLVVWNHAFIVVFGLHLPRPELTAPSIVDRGGHFGVDLFFVISGFIMGRLAFVENSPDPWTFVKRRLERIVPLYWLVSLPWALWTGASATALLTTLTFWPAWSVMTEPVLTLGWSLSFEMLFYAALTVVLSAKNRILTVSIILALFCICISIRGGPHAAWADFLGNLMILEFLAGLAIAFSWRRSRPRLGIISLSVGILAAVLGMMIFAKLPDKAVEAWAGTGDATRVMIYGPAAALILWGAIQLTPKGRVVDALAYLGGASYSLYLIHPVVVTAFGRLGRALPVSSDQFMILEMTAAIVAAVAVHELLEKPVLNWFRRRGHWLLFERAA